MESCEFARGAGTPASKFLPTLLMLPVFMVILPLSAIAGVVYALQYNRSGSRQRLFGDKDNAKQKQLSRASARAHDASDE